MPKHSKIKSTNRSRITEDAEPYSFKKQERPTEPTTRICIKNIPPSVKNVDQVKQFLFASKEAYFPSVSLTITDCRLLPKRRMAFAGFQTQDCASSCVKYLQGTYWKTTKIIVEFAFPPKTSDLKKTVVLRKADYADEKKMLTVDGTSVPVEKKNASSLTIKEPERKIRAFWSNDDEKEVLVRYQRQDTEQTNLSDHEDDTPNSSDNSCVDYADPLLESKKGMSDIDFLLAKTIEADQLPEEMEDFSSASESTVVDVEKFEMEDNENGKSTQQHGPTVENLEMQDATAQAPSRRLFIRNLPFSVIEDDLHQYFSQFGPLDECHIPVDDHHRTKGFGFVSFRDSSHAKKARQECDGKDFQGRLIQILPAQSAKTSPKSNIKLSSFKKEREMEKIEHAGKDHTGWSASYIRGDAVIDSLASRLGLRKGDILGVKDNLSAGDAAVRMALGETAIIEENRKYFATHGVNMDALVSMPRDNQSGPQNTERSKTSILVKNLPADTAKDELMKVFGSAGVNPTRILLPPSRTIALVEYGHMNESKKAFKRLAYRRFRDVPLYLEWAPLAAKLGELASTKNDGDLKIAKDEDTEEKWADDSLTQAARPTIFVKNLNFSTSEEDLEAHVSAITEDILAVRIPKKVAPAKFVAGKVIREEKTLSMGFGFVEFRSKEAAMEVLERLQGKTLAGHPLELEPVKPKGQKNIYVSTKKKSSKLLVRNVPFQANKKELLMLFGSFGQLKKVRLPRKADGNHRGFAFVDYVSSKEAGEAMKSLSRTHLYGRHLVTEWAEDEGTGVDEASQRSNIGFT